MKVLVAANVLTVVTNLQAELVKKGGKVLTAKDEKGNEVYRISAAEDGKNGSLDAYGIKTNTTVDGKAAVVIIEANGTTREQIKEKYGKAVLAANKYVASIAASVASEAAQIDEAFGDDTATAVTVDAE